MNEHERIVFHGSYIDISENKHFLELENNVCYFNYPNANGRQMNYGSTKEEQAATLERAKTLCLMPVYAKCAKNRKGQPTFKGHEAKVKNGELEFDTVPIGVHVDVSIEERDVVAVDGTAQRLPVLVAKQRIWKRNKNAVAAIQRLFAENKLYNSWEVEVTQYAFKDGIKYLEEYSFLGNAFLGYEFAKPAFGQASAVVSVAEELEGEYADCELMIAEALYLDSQDGHAENPAAWFTQTGTNEVSKKMENEVLEVLNETIDNAEQVEEQEVVETAEENQEPDDNSQTDTVSEVKTTIESSALTTRDLQNKLQREFRDDGYIAFLFPAENEALFHSWKDDELGFTSVKYEVLNDEVKILEKTPVKLTVNPIKLNAEISTRDEKIAELEAANNELNEYKEKYEAVELEKAETAKKVKRENMENQIKRCGLFSEKEIASEPISKMIEDAEEDKLKVYIAERLISTAKPKEEVAEVTPAKSLESDDVVSPGQRLANYLRTR